PSCENPPERVREAPPPGGNPPVGPRQRQKPTGYIGNHDWPLSSRRIVLPVSEGAVEGPLPLRTPFSLPRSWFFGVGGDQFPAGPREVPRARRLSRLSAKAALA